MLITKSQCDESQPACVNCVTAQKECSYSRTSSSEALNERNPVSISKSNGLEKAKSFHLSVTSDVASLSSRSVSPVTPLPVPYVNLLHLELFQNVTSNGLAFHDDSSQSSEWVTTTIRVSPEIFLDLHCSALATSPLGVLSFHLKGYKTQNPFFINV